MNIKKNGAIAILASIIGLPSSGFVVKYAWDRVEANTQKIQELEKEESANEVRFKYIKEALDKIDKKLDK